MDIFTCHLMADIQTLKQFSRHLQQRVISMLHDNNLNFLNSIILDEDLALLNVPEIN